MQRRWHGTLSLILLLLAASRLAVKGTPAQAQQGVLTSVRQSVTFVYGDRLTFALEATAPAPLTAAHLTIFIDHRDTPYTVTPYLIAGSTVTIIHSVPVQELALPPFAGLTYYWELQDESGQQYRTDPQQVRYEDTSVPWEWSTSQQGNIVIHSDGDDPALASAALEIARNAVAQINSLLGTTYGSAAGEVLHLYLYSELAPLASGLRLHGQRVQDWITAYTIPEQGVALIAALPGPQQIANLQRDIPHAVAHIMLASAMGSSYPNMPAWLNEGLALMTAPEPDVALESALAAAVREGHLLPLETLCVPHFRDLSPQEAALAYAQSESITRYIASRFGTSQVRMLLTAYANTLPCERAVEEALGLSLTELESQWHNDLARRLARAPRENPSLVPWLIVWGVSVILALLFIAPQPQRVTASSLRRSGIPANPPPTTD